MKRPSSENLPATVSSKRAAPEPLKRAPGDLEKQRAHERDIQRRLAEQKKPGPASRSHTKTLRSASCPDPKAAQKAAARGEPLPGRKPEQNSCGQESCPTRCPENDYGYAGDMHSSYLYKGGGYQH